MRSAPIYLDNAATSFPKPRSVIDDTLNCLEHYCGNAGRGAHRLSLAASNKLYDCREALCALFNAPSPECICFVPSCTVGLNMTIKGILRAGDGVIISDMEHNAVLRPLKKLEGEGMIELDVFPALSCSSCDEEKLIDNIASKIKNNTRLLICNHQSNICSYSLPVSRIGKLCKEKGILFALDCAQSAGHLAIDMQKMNISFLCAPGHKGLYGIQGSAFVAINSSILPETLIEGGNGINSLEQGMGFSLPERYEAGTLSLPAIVGLHAGVREVERIGIESIRAHECELFRHLRDGLLNITGARVHAQEFEGSTLSFDLATHSCERICAILDDAGICVRGGFHCSALAHTSLKTTKEGTVRVSFSIFNTKKEVNSLLAVLNKIKK